MKIQKKKKFGGGGAWVRAGGRVGGGVKEGRGGCEWRSEAFVKINFIFFWGGSGQGGGVGLGGVRVDENGELKLL